MGASCSSSSAAADASSNAPRTQDSQTPPVQIVSFSVENQGPSSRFRRESQNRGDVVDDLLRIAALQESLAAIEELFLSLLNVEPDPLHEVLDPANAEVRGPPPATQEAVNRLPRYLLQEVPSIARQCGICLEKSKVNDAVLVLPCGHFYHAPCIQEWLGRHCTCPTCRYELPTDDASYEVERVRRMSLRSASTDLPKFLETQGNRDQRLRAHAIILQEEGESACCSTRDTSSRE